MPISLEYRPPNLRTTESASETSRPAELTTTQFGLSGVGSARALGLASVPRAMLVSGQLQPSESRPLKWCPTRAGQDPNLQPSDP
jgi:hypothetical protein